MKDILLETDRLIMRAYSKEDAELFYAVVSRREIAETTVNIPHPYPKETVSSWLNYMRESHEKGDSHEFGLFKKDDPQCYIGNCGLVSVSKQHNNGELGYFIDPSVWGLGYGTEACIKVVEFGFFFLGLERIYGRCMTKNLASRRVMEKSGLKYEGLAKHEVLKCGVYEDVWKFGLIRSEWT